MVDLIDRDELFNYVQKEKAWKQSRMKQPRYEQGLYDAWYEMLDIIKAQPTVDTERHAHWIKSEIPYGEYICSNCGGACWYYDSSGTVYKSKYCPNCGCKMDEVSK